MSNRVKELRGQRIPLLGYYQGDNPDVLDWQIKFAVDHGITFFVFDDYWTDGADGPAYGGSASAFLRARHREFMQFAMMVTSLLTRAEDWQSEKDLFLRQVVPYYVAHYLNKPNYLQADGKPVIGIIAAGATFRGAPPAEVKAIFDLADAQIAAATKFRGAFWMTCDPMSSPVDFTLAKTCGFSAVMPYYIAPYLYPSGLGWDAFPIHPLAGEKGTNGLWPVGLPFDTVRPMSVEQHKRSLIEAERKKFRFITAISADFDSRPYTFMPKHLYFAHHSRDEYAAMVAQSANSWINTLRYCRSVPTRARRWWAWGPGTSRWNRPRSSRVTPPSNSATTIRSSWSRRSPRRLVARNGMTVLCRAIIARLSSARYMDLSHGQLGSGYLGGNGKRHAKAHTR